MKSSGANGRTPGVQNYDRNDLKMLFSLIIRHKPGGMSGWEAVGRDYNEYAARAGRTCREPKALREKFERVSNYNSEFMFAFRV